MAGLGASLTEQPSPISVLFWGPEGSGKTTAAVRMTGLAKGKQKVLIVNAEAGAKVEALAQRGVDVSKIETWPPDGNPESITYESMRQLAEDLRANSADYVGVIWDSGTEITKRLLDQVVAASEEKDRRLGKNRAPFQVNLEDHGVASSMLRDLLRRFRDLPMHLVVTALERRDVDQNTGLVKYGPAMAPAMANDAAGLVDIVGFTSVEEVGGVEVRSAQFTATGLRRAKDRYGMLPSKLADPYFDRLHDYIRGKMTRENDPVQKRIRELATGQTKTVETSETATTGTDNTEEK